MEKIKDPIQLKKFYSVLMIEVPSILLVIASMGIPNFLTRSITQIILFVLQFLVVKGILDDYYSQ